MEGRGAHFGGGGREGLEDGNSGVNTPYSVLRYSYSVYFLGSTLSPYLIGLLQASLAQFSTFGTLYFRQA